MTTRPHWLRMYAPPRRQEAPITRPMPSDGCAVCRDGRLPCVSPDSCFMAEADGKPARLPFFCASPLASAAIWLTVLVGVGVLAWVW